MKILDLMRKKDEVPMCSAVIVAAGSSQRMGTDKILRELGGIPVLIRTLKVFDACKCVDEIIVVTRMSALQEVSDLCKKSGLNKLAKVVAGGETRMESALAGVTAVKKSAKYIAVHDGARPFVTDELICATALAAKKNHAAVPVVKCSDTLKALDGNGFIVGTVDRETTLRVQTPQIFSADILKGALTNAVKKGLSLTDDASAVEAMGIKTATVPGEEDNIKLTTPRDLLIAELILKDRGEIV